MRSIGRKGDEKETGHIQKGGMIKGRSEGMNHSSI